MRYRGRLSCSLQLRYQGYVCLLTLVSPFRGSCKKFPHRMQYVLASTQTCFSPWVDAIGGIMHRSRCQLIACVTGFSEKFLTQGGLPWVFPSDRNIPSATLKVTFFPVSWFWSCPFLFMMSKQEKQPSCAGVSIPRYFSRTLLIIYSFFYKKLGPFYKKQCETMVTDHRPERTTMHLRTTYKALKRHLVSLHIIEFNSFSM